MRGASRSHRVSIPQRVIEAKRNGDTLERDDLEAFFMGYLDGSVQEYQMAAFLMAVVFQGMSADELDALVSVMIASGDTLDLGYLDGPRIDKHSTGGVGDKVSLVLAPLAAELGMRMPKMSGHALGHTGGTLDKLESIPGFRTDLGAPELLKVLESVGVAMIGQTEKIAPLDRRLYDLRSVTGTVPAIPLIASSIMSKKLAEDLTGLVLDVKLGSGAFIPDEDHARELARTMVEIGTSRGVPTVALLTAMDRPLGRAVGNALEVREALACLAGDGPGDLREVVLALAAEMLVLGGLAGDTGGARERASRTLAGGGPRERFARMVEAQGGDPAVVEDPTRLPRAAAETVVEAPRDGWIHSVAPAVLGRGVVDLGGGRTRLGQEIDRSVGFVLAVTPGDRVAAGEPLGTVHARTPAEAERGAAILRGAVELGEGPSDVEPLPLIAGRVAAGEGLSRTV